MRKLSGPAIRAVLSRETDSVFVPLLKISHPDIATIYICGDTAQVVRSDGTYLPFPFELILPPDSDGELPLATLRVDNVTKEIVKAIRTLTGRPKVTFLLVLADSPEVVEYGPAEFLLGNAEWDALQIMGTLSYQEDIWMQSSPGNTYTPSNSPGLFR
ncbi:MAG: DUF1833 family protein [Telluria sp.]